MRKTKENQAGPMNRKYVVMRLDQPMTCHDAITAGPVTWVAIHEVSAGVSAPVAGER